MLNKDFLTLSLEQVANHITHYWGVFRMCWLIGSFQMASIYTAKDHLAGCESTSFNIWAIAHTQLCSASAENWEKVTLPLIWVSHEKRAALGSGGLLWDAHRTLKGSSFPAPHQAGHNIENLLISSCKLFKSAKSTLVLFSFFPTFSCPPFFSPSFRLRTTYLAPTAYMLPPRCTIKGLS